MRETKYTFATLPKSLHNLLCVRSDPSEHHKCPKKRHRVDLSFPWRQSRPWVIRRVIHSGSMEHITMEIRRGSWASRRLDSWTDLEDFNVVPINPSYPTPVSRWSKSGTTEKKRQRNPLEEVIRANASTHHTYEKHLRWPLGCSNVISAKRSW